jgi:FkbM family methyltransferase
MNISIHNPNGKATVIRCNAEMQKHTGIPINHVATILNQINSGLYDKWFAGKKDLSCIDFGGNVGLTALYMLPHCKQLIVVEPTPSHVALLKGNLQSIVSSEDVSKCKLIVSETALSDKDAPVKFASGHSTENKIGTHGNHVITVPGKPLSWYVRGEVDFIKVDIESGEMIALTEDELIKVHGKVKTFFIEVHPGFNGDMESNVNELVRRFKKVGYKVCQEDYQTIIAEL